jgi:hypothetical protein
LASAIIFIISLTVVLNVRIVCQRRTKTAAAAAVSVTSALLRACVHALVDDDVCQASGPLPEITR